MIRSIIIEKLNNCVIQFCSLFIIKTEIIIYFYLFSVI